MQTLITIIAFLLIFSFVVLMHELGHFLAAKRAGIKVEEFGIGLPPRVFGKKKGETIYSVNWIPFGGFVKMLGSDPRDPQAKKSKRSYLNKPLRSRIWVAIAGVVMNLVLAAAFLTFGFWMGIEPLIVDMDDFFDGMRSGQVVTELGFYVYQVEEGSEAEMAGVEPGDRLLKMGDSEFDDAYEFYALIDEMEVGEYVDFEVENLDGEVETLELLNSESGFGIDLYLFELPRSAVYEIDPGSDFAIAGLQVGDVILKVDGQEVFYVEDLDFYASDQIDLEVYRDGEVVNVLGERVFERSALVSDVLAGSPAEEAGLQEGDLVISIDGENVYDYLDVYEITIDSESETLRYVVMRDGEQLVLDVGRGEDGLVGVYVSNVTTEWPFRLYESSVPTSVIEILPEQHGLFAAPVAAVKEVGRLTVLTMGMLKDLVGNIVNHGQIPDTVAGPVGIAQMTHVFVQQGFAAIIRFIALLNLGLAVFNILPFPALDGGRFVFLMFEAVTGRKPNEKFEAWLHGLGFFLLMLLLLAVTYQDIVRLITG